ncbi:MAG: hypothetical protein K2O00_03295 [Muribaculaceae bacterium]|nr:hypothetical protein [Muribaculaceae bacterium]
MKKLLFLIVVASGLFSSVLLAQTNQIRGVKKQMEQTNRASLDRIPKVPKVPRVSINRKLNWTVPDINLPKSLQSENKYQSAFDSLSKNSTATGEDYMLLYFTMGSDSLYSQIVHHLKYETIADKYLDIDRPTPEQLAEVLAIAQLQFPNQRYIGMLHTPSTLLLERATTRYYLQVLADDSTFTNQDAAILSQLYDEYRQKFNNEGSILYYYLTESYEYALPPLERYFGRFEEYPESDGYITRHISEIAPKFRILERCYEAMGLSERRDSLLANPTYQRVIKLETAK